ncbi:MAG: 50S ribosome-binding GTPase [Alphaproteobacteria bacterium]|nr:50S ribosome-binding GTPase [Alphaproteobacteria bacterium]
MEEPEQSGLVLREPQLPAPVVEDPLAELLRRCHRAEILPLAEVLGINPTGMGLSQLCRASAQTLRRRGAQDVWNIVFRKGDGPSYADVVRDLAKRKSVALPAGADIEAVEKALLDWWVSEAWSEMPQEERDRVWRRLQLELPAPADGNQALISMAERLKIGAKYGAGVMALSALRVAPFLFPPLLPLAGCLSLFWLGRPRDELLLPAVLEVSALRQTVRHRVTVGIVGSPSSGKDAAINAIFGIDSGNVNPVAGSTKEVEINRLPNATALYVVNTPGMGDIIESVTEEARQVLDLIDVFVYLVNAQGGVQSRELADYRACVARNRPVLAVINKIDTLRESDRERYLTDARGKLGAPEDSFLSAAFDPLPQLSDAPIGVGAVRDWIARHLEGLGKDPRELPWIEAAAEGPVAPEIPGIEDAVEVLDEP